MRLFMRFILHTLLCVSILFLVLALPLILTAFFSKTFEDLYRFWFYFSIFVHIVLIIYFYMSKKYSLFALPLSHILFPILFFFVTYPFRLTLSQATGSLWEGFVFISALYYFLPISVITFIISLIIKLKK